LMWQFYFSFNNFDLCVCPYLVPKYLCLGKCCSRRDMICMRGWNNNNKLFSDLILMGALGPQFPTYPSWWSPYSLFLPSSICISRFYFFLKEATNQDTLKVVIWFWDLDSLQWNGDCRWISTIHFIYAFYLFCEF
jgi:hypothetical protein